MTTVRVGRLRRGPDLVINDAEELARIFFANDLSTGFALKTKNSPRTNADRIGVDDIREVNSVMRARTAYSRWSDLTGAGRLYWLKAIDPEWDLIEMDEGFWVGRARRPIQVALQEVIQFGRGRSVATKVLHLKRPRLFPILDALVVEQLGVPVDGGPDAIELIDHLREQGRRNQRQLRKVQAFLGEGANSPSHIRIFDALLWSAHPAASIAQYLESWTRSIERQ